MLNLEKSVRILEFDKILAMLASVAMTEGAKNRALSLIPTDNLESVKRRQRLTSDAKKMSEIKGAPSFGNMPDILDSVEKAEKQSILSTREILDVASVLSTVRSLIEYIKSDAISRCLLSEYFDNLADKSKEWLEEYQCPNHTEYIEYRVRHRCSLGLSITY